MINYKKDVRVTAEMSRYSDCCCDMCFKTDYVIKVRIPYTKYQKDGNLGTRYREMWMCESCRDKLVKAVSFEYPQEERRDGNTNP